MELILVVLILVVACLSCLGYHLLIQNGRLLLRLETIEKELIGQGVLPEPGRKGLRAGTILAEFALPSLSGDTVTLSQFRGTKVLLVFIHPHCGVSTDLLDRLSRLSQTHLNRTLAPIFLSTGGLEENRRLFQKWSLPYQVLLQDEREVAAMYLVYGTPMGYLVDENGRTASEMLIGSDALLAVLQAPTTDFEKANFPGQAGVRRKFTGSLEDSRLIRNGLKAGTKAPDFTLPQLDGTPLSLDSLRGRTTLLVFSDPSCSPCTRLAPSLEQVHLKSRDLNVLMISRGEPEENLKKVAELGLTFPVVLQRHWEISKSYGIFATPIGYLINESGTLASDVAVGAEAILELAARQEKELKGLATSSAD